jgi:hypothetical protein
MKFKTTSMIALAMLFGAGVFLYQQVQETQFRSRSNRIPIIKSQENPAAAFTKSEYEGAFIAILVVPKAYQPLLAKFNRLKIAKKIQIIPAVMAWNEGEPIVVPQEYRNDSRNGMTFQNSKSPDSTGKQSVGEVSNEKKNILAVAFIKLLAETVKRNHSLMVK